MNNILAIALYLTTPIDYSDDICLELTSYMGNVTHLTINTHHTKARLRFTRYGYSLATDKAIYIGNRNEVIYQFKQDNCPRDFI